MNDSADPDSLPEQQTGVGPQARLTLPDGQGIDAEVIRRERDSAGVWWYTLRIDLPSRVDTPTGSHVEPRTVEVSGRYPDEVQPIAGEDYSGLDPQAVGPAGSVILVQRRWRADVGDLLLHRDDCWVATNAKDAVGIREAARLLAGGAVACDVCRPEVGLRG
ncbi:DUF6233 domain-containing protein [Streptomyces sp. H10-C2]|uniref:DUF6233 domain-containing protein n=1 Tax=unclassified Streptomyces TaxID=2593676 RepID=UPI0024B9D550|nr:MULTISPECIES: DUF6233 domain-containing protein [unclassified Streptomyces]MDJ0345229.1 DUF6233 domain-containing protein [Streptomyces sp. PH10-H1]MDJ0368825.1 DUF6233 domain-containing protein [Streptomyces sp. H10-C2]